MKSYIPYLKYGFLVAFLLGATGVTAYDLMYTKPKKKCDAEAKWWSDKEWKCYTPVSISTFTGRTPEMPQKTEAPASK